MPGSSRVARPGAPTHRGIPCSAMTELSPDRSASCTTSCAPTAPPATRRPRPRSGARGRDLRAGRPRRARLELRRGRPGGRACRPAARPHRRDRPDRLAYRGSRGRLRREAARPAARRRDSEVLVGQHVELRTADGRRPRRRRQGPDPPRTPGRPARSTIENLWVDIGANDAEDGAVSVAVGDTVVWPATRASSRTISSPARRSTTATAPGWCWRPHDASPRPVGGWSGGRRRPRHRGDAGGRGARRCTSRRADDGDRRRRHARLRHPRGRGGTDPRAGLGRGPMMTRGLGLNRGLTARLRRAPPSTRIAFQVEAPLPAAPRRTRMWTGRSCVAGRQRARARLDPAPAHALAGGGVFPRRSRTGCRADRTALSLEGDEDWR